jgi:hypothetical protein
VTVRRTIGSGYLKETTSGVFVIVNVTMTNTKSSPTTILAPNLDLKARSGDSYETTSKAALIKNALTVLTSLQPKLPKTVLLVYEVPRSAVRGAVLEIEDIGSGDKAKIRLGT